jgi:hypothetical protein
VLPTSPLSPQLPQDALSLVHPSVWQQLPEPPRQQCHDRIAQLLTAMVHGEQSKEHRHA